MIRKAFFTTAIILSLSLTVNAQRDTILNRYNEYLFKTGQPADIAALKHSLNSNGTWPDINYGSISRANWPAIEHLKRLQNLAIAWSNPRSTAYHDSTLWNSISKALNSWVYRRLYNPNWWYNEIGVPQYFQNILSLLYPYLNKYERTRSLEELAQYRINGTGTNLIWSAELGFFYSALVNDTARMRHCIDTIFNEIRINTGEGIQPDYSFHMHGNRLQIYSYGSGYLKEIVKLAEICKGTNWAFPEDKIKLITDFVLNGWQWMSRGINTVPGTIDRVVSRQNSLHAADIRTVIPGLIQLNPEKATALNEILNWQNGKGDPLIGFRYYPYSDFAAYQSKRFSFFLKTISTRTPASESINSENLKGNLLNSGDSYLVQDGTEYFNLMPVWNWAKLPGITTFKGARRIIRKPFAGSAGKADGGLTAMDYEMIGKDTSVSVKAHKVWVYHNGLVVCLIADLTATHVDGGVSTVLDQCRLNGDVMINHAFKKVGKGNHVLKGVKWIYHHGFAYIPIIPSTIDLYSGTVRGSWKSINTSESDSLVVDSVFIPELAHGENPKNLSTAYMLTNLPSAPEVDKLRNDPPFTILRNDKICQAVKFADGVVMAAFFSASDLTINKDDKIKVNKPCLLLVSKNEIYISDPTHRGGEIEVQMDKDKLNIQVPTDGTTAVATVDKS